MTKHLTESEFTRLQGKLSSGEARLSIPRHVARQLFLRISNEAIESSTEQNVLLEKTLVWAGYVGSPLLLAIAGLYMLVAHGWWSAASIPLTGIFWAILTGLTHDRGGWLSVSITVVASLVFMLIVPLTYALPVFLFSLSIWAHRMTFIYAQRMLLALVASSYFAYDMLTDHIDVIDT